MNTSFGYHHVVVAFVLTKKFIPRFTNYLFKGDEKRRGEKKIRTVL